MIQLLLPALLLFADPAPPTPTVASDVEKVREFATGVAQSLNERDVEAINAAFDVGELLLRVLNFEEIRVGTRIGFSTAFRAAFAPGEDLCQNVMTEGAWAEALRVTKNEDGSFTSLIRVVRRKTVFLYFEFRVVPREDGWAISDSLSSLIPQWSSEYQQDLLAGGRSKAGSAERQARAKANRELVELDREPEAVLARLKELEQESAVSFLWQVQRVRALGRLRRFEEMASAVEAASKLDSTRITAAMIAFDISQAAKRYEEAIPYLDLIDRWAGEDPYLEFVRGSLYQSAGKFELAIENYERSIEEDPYIYAPYRDLLNVGVGTKRWALVAKTLDGAEKYLESDFSSLHEAEAWAGFFASEEGKRWHAAWRERNEKPEEGQTPSDGD